MSDQVKSVARLIGNSYAHVQHGIDCAIEWGFETMAAQEKTRKPVKTDTAAGKAAAVGRGIFGVLGAAGEAYFTTYSELKKKAK